MALAPTSRLNPAQQAIYQDLRTLDLGTPGAEGQAARIADFLDPFRRWLR